eukprot:CAMPEP_0115164728 /NCGR_PEP_ID=MMETSP0227-20121206/73193_1 /TAXON_ID=89957 /ORGANISM="Polarella glacialis, Strain CCMP 1383" /LENGTH=228 /DNA_ID=CAMNT_0002577111 /DNA_START=214 /DNA_END=900 /DNA_ORIENTATION=+
MVLRVKVFGRLLAQRQEPRVSHTVELTFADNEDTHRLWPHKFLLKYTVSLRSNGLSISLEVQNTGEVAWDFTGCLHTFFYTPDIRRVKLFGLQGANFQDKVDRDDAGPKEKTEKEEAIVVADASAASAGFVDRIYKHSPKSLRLLDEGAGVSITIEQSDSWTDTVVFNPWEDGKKGDKGLDFDDDGYNYLICVEPAVTAHHKQEMPPGASWSGFQNIQISAICAAECL